MHHFPRMCDCHGATHSLGMVCSPGFIFGKPGPGVVGLSGSGAFERSPRGRLVIGYHLTTGLIIGPPSMLLQRQRSLS